MNNPTCVKAFLFSLLIVGGLFIRCNAQYTITGRIVNEHGTEVAFANVLLLGSNDSILVKGAIADQSGNFALSHPASGAFILESYMVGFTKTYSEIIHLTDNHQIQMADIVLHEDIRELEEVVVKADKPMYEMEMGKMIVNVSSNVTATSQSVIKVLERSPGISVNRQNLTLSLNGKNNVIVLMNGERNRMPAEAVFQLLEGLNAGDVEKIEIMSIPPAKYDADGDAGFINIISKEHNGTGTRGTFTGNLGYGTGPQSGGSINLSHNSSKLTIYGNYSFNRIHRNQIAEFNRDFVDENGSSSAYTYFDRDIVRQIQNFQLGADLNAGKRTVISALIAGYENIFKYDDGSSNGIYQYPNVPDTLVDVTFSGNSNWKHLMTNLNLKHTFANDHVLDINLDYLTYGNYYPSEYDNRYLDEFGNEIKKVDRKILKKTPIQFWVGKVDYSFGMGKHMTWDSGIKGTFSQLSNDINARDYFEGSWVKNTNFSDQSELDEDILAAFTQLNSKIGEFTILKVGMRYEYTSTILSSNDNRYNVNRKYGNFFPSVFYSYQFNQDQTVQFSYGRRITRPTFTDMAPFIIFVDPNTLFSGNPNILPTLTNNISISYSLKSYTLSVQYSIDKNAIYGVQPNPDLAKKILFYQSKNIDLRRTLSVTPNLPFAITEWWESQNSLTYIFQHLSGNQEGTTLDYNQQIAQVNTTQTFKLPKDYTIEVAGIYNSPTVNGYSSSPSNGSLDIGIQKVFNNEGTLRLSCNDILETTRWQATAAFNNGFSMESWYKFDKRIYSVSYSQPLGNKKARGARKRSIGSEEELKRVTN